MPTCQIIKHTYTLWYQVIILTANVSKFFPAALTGRLPWARGQTVREQRRLNQAHSCSWEALVALLGKGWTPGLFQCGALLCHYPLKLLILCV